MSEVTDTLTCAVSHCPNNNLTAESLLSREDLTYHRFPQDPALRIEWVKACLLPEDWADAEFSYVCSDHFDPTDFNYPEPGSQEVNLTPDAIPSVNIGIPIKQEPEDQSLQELANVNGLDIIMGADGNDDEIVYLNADDGQEVFLRNDLIQDDANNERHECLKCSRQFKTETRLQRHEMFCKMQEKKNSIGPRAKSGTSCFVEGCPARFYHRNKMVNHMETVHRFFINEKQKLKFSNMEEFWTWKENEEERTYSYFSKRSGTHRNSATYHCQRDGPSRAYRDKTDNPRLLKRQLFKGNIKKNIVCLAHIKTTLNLDGTVSAVYFPSHNHPLSAMDYLHHPLSRATQMFIREKLELGYSPKQIADELVVRQNASGSREGANNMSKNQFLHMVNKLDRIRGFLDRERRRMKAEAAGKEPVRQRRSRKAILEEQFEKSRQYQQEIEEFKRSIVDDDGMELEDGEGDKNIFAEELMNQNKSLSDMFSAENDEEGETVEGDYVDESNTQGVEGIICTEELLRTLEGATGVICKQEDVIQELSLDDSTRSSSPSQSTDYKKLYKEALVANHKLVTAVNDLTKRLDKKEKQVTLLINALKKSLSKEPSYLESLKESVSDGDYEIIVI